MQLRWKNRFSRGVMTQNILLLLFIYCCFVCSTTLANMSTRQRKALDKSKPPQMSSQIKFSIPPQKKGEDRFMAWYERHERTLTGILYGTFMLLILVVVIYLCILMVYQYNSVPQKYYRWLGVTYNTSISGCKSAYEKLLTKQYVIYITYQFYHSLFFDVVMRNAQTVQKKWKESKRPMNTLL